jgi:fermentation-respiration switch protein FrsA (DUF1100 family)
MKRTIRIVKRLAAAVIAVYIVLLGTLYIEQRSLLFHRTTERPMLNIAALEPRRSIVCLETADDLALRSWYFAPARPGAPAVLFLHGNAGDIGNHIPAARFLIDAGYGVLAMEYRGYAGNPGSPSEDGLYEDARAAFAFLNRQGFADRDIVLFGESLGTGVAVEMASEHAVAAMVLRSPYSAMPDIAAVQFPYFPVHWLVRDRFDSLSKIARSQAPLMVFHGDADTLIPIAYGRRLYDAASGPKTWLVVPGAGHNDVQTPAAEQTVLAFLAKAVPERPGVAAGALPSLTACGS